MAIDHHKQIVWTQQIYAQCADKERFPELMEEHAVKAEGDGNEILAKLLRNAVRDGRPPMAGE